MPNSEKVTNPTLPITIPYQDKLDFAYFLLIIYSNIVTELTSRDKDILAVALIYDVNGDDFKEILLSDNIGLTSANSIKTQMHRLKSKDLIVPHVKYNRKVLHPHMEAFRGLIHNDADAVSLNLIFERIGTKK